MQDYSADGVRQERTGWRCQDISERHRIWGFDCPAVDLDFVMAEYNHGKPVAIVEYKHCQARIPNLNHATYLALKDLADNRKSGAIPFFVVFYDPINWTFRILPVNDCAVEFYKHVGEIEISEQRFVKSLYLLRKKILSDQDERLIAELNAINGGK